jgi:putative endonuclease
MPENSISTGKLGEDIAERFLRRKGYEVLERNHRIYHGEIDIIAKDLDEVVFVEVKTISCENTTTVTRETYRPEFNITKDKIRLISRSAEIYMSSNRLDGEWRIDVIAIELDRNSKKARVRHTKSVYL